jgi:hypothetical protein
MQSFQVWPPGGLHPHYFYATTGGEPLYNMQKVYISKVVGIIMVNLSIWFRISGTNRDLISRYAGRGWSFVGIRVIYKVSQITVT